jgi:peptidoglycan/LPS O-acetylase OafA/YrhL
MVVALAALGAPESRAWGGFRWLTARAWLGFPLAALLWAAAYAIDHYSSLKLIVLGRAVYFVACGLILGCSVVAGRWSTRAVRVLAPLGLVSYGVYLWHGMVIKLLYAHTSVGLHGIGLPWLVDSLLVLAITLPCAALSWFGIERPLMQRAAGWARRHTMAAPTGAVVSVGAR